MKQLDLFKVAKAYVDKPSLSQGDLYEYLAQAEGIAGEFFARKVPIGRGKAAHSPLKRKVRWYQQTLKAMGLLERSGRGEWRLSAEGKGKLSVAKEGQVMLAYATDLGVAIWGSCLNVFGGSLAGETISLCLTSPPYPLSSPRAYGNPSAAEYIDFICGAIEPITKHHKTGGSIALNISNDIFLSRSPARNSYLERLVIAFEDRLGLSIMDRLVWENPNKPPGPIAYASKTRQHLNVGYEMIYWFSNDPHACTSDNRRVLLPHSDQHQKLIARGGESRQAVYGDGAYRIYPGSFSNPTPGKIPRNILNISGNCASQRSYKKHALELGLQAHGAPYPLALASFLVQFLTQEGELVVDPFGGSLTTALAAEKNNRRWMASEIVYDYIRGSAGRFLGSAGLRINPGFVN